MTFSDQAIETATHPLEKVLKTGGVIGLIAVMLVGFLMMVVYQGQRDMQEVHMQMVETQKEQLKTEREIVDILTDVRYMFRAGSVTLKPPPPTIQTK